jgi:menaquinone-dependent protoporphyrinogen oxidase
MKVLIAVASRHGSTREIADTIAEELRANGNVAGVRDMTAAECIAEYDAVILGSAVYAGQWLPEARRFVVRQRERLAELPVWLFSSGPTGVDPWPPGEPDGVAELAEAIGARERVLFTGKLNLQALGFVDRVIVQAIHAPEGDFRDWSAIRNWARGIAASLAPAAV